MKKQTAAVPVETVLIITIAVVIIALASLLYSYNIRLMEVQGVQKVEATK